MIKINEDLWVNPVNVEMVEVRTGGVKVTFVSGGHIFSTPRGTNLDGSVTHQQVIDHAEEIVNAITFGVDA